MGQNFTKDHFSESDFIEFKHRLRKETALLMRYFDEDRFNSSERSLGLEIETCLVDSKFEPAPKNKNFLESLDNPLVVPELSKFNAEINSDPVDLKNDCLSKLHQDLKRTWASIQKHSQKLKLHMLTTGILPTLKDHMLSLEHMSDCNRYRVLNEQIMSLRQNQDVRLNIKGIDLLDICHRDIMLEAAGTSLQIHLQIESEKSVRLYNASLIASAPIAAIAANAPFLFEKNLWAETRIPLFERAVELPGFHDIHGDTIRRVTFGSGYLNKSLRECFLENLDGFPVLLPILYEQKEESFSHLRFHNGTIWRWNRPILGFNTQNQPRLRLEHRVPSSGPSLIDMVANIAFYVGLAYELCQQEEAPEHQLSFETVRSNFYQAAKHGLEAHITWLDGQEYRLPQLLQDILIPMAVKGLTALDVAKEDINLYLNDIMMNRAQSKQTGSQWQRDFIVKNGPNFTDLVKNYYDNQERDIPIHQWDL